MSHLILIAFLNMHVENLTKLELGIAGITAVIFIAAVASVHEKRISRTYGVPKREEKDQSV